MSKKYHVGHKLTALGFIILILAGNFAWIELLSNKEPSAGWSDVFFIGFGFVAIGGVSTALFAIKNYFSKDY